MQSDERLGRRLSERNPRYIKRIQRNTDANKKPFHFKLFKPNMGEVSISVDRLDLSPIEKVAEIATRDAKHDRRVFYGWVVFSRQTVLQIGFRVYPSPDSGNPYHADLFYPDDIKDENEQNEKIKTYAGALIESATWLPRPK